MPSLARRVLAEVVGTAFLLIAVIGSGIAASHLSNNAGEVLFENAIVTGMALAVIILAVGPVSGAHLNPLVSLADRVFGGLSTRELGAYVAAQVAGGVLGAVIANLMFSQPAFEVSTKVRPGAGLWLGEVVATLGLLLVVFGLARAGRAAVTAFAVGGYIAAAYFFTSSTSFANPAVTVARMFSNTFAGIAPKSVVPFLIAQLLGAGFAVLLVRALYPRPERSASNIPVPRTEERYARDRLRAVARTEGLMTKDKPEVLFVCVHNAGRSQMAAALLDHHAEGRVHVRSAGSEPADRLNPAVAEAMAEIGLDISKEFPKPLADEIVRDSDVVITMGCGDACAVYPGKKYLDWELDDPAGKPVEEVRPIRDEIDRRVRELLDQLVPAAQ